MWARTLCPLVSSTRNIAFGRASSTDPSISMTPSFLAITLFVTGLVAWSCGDWRAQRHAGARRTHQSSSLRYSARSRQLERRSRRTLDAALGERLPDALGHLVGR